MNPRALSWSLAALGTALLAWAASGAYLCAQVWAHNQRIARDKAARLACTTDLPWRAD